MYFITALLPQAMSCHFTGWCIVLTIKSQSSSSLPIPLFMQGYELRLLTWMKASLPKATSFPGKWKVAKQMMGRRLSQEEAKRLLAKLE